MRGSGTRVKHKRLQRTREEVDEDDEEEEEEEEEGGSRREESTNMGSTNRHEECNETALCMETRYGREERVRREGENERMKERKKERKKGKNRGERKKESNARR